MGFWRTIEDICVQEAPTLTVTGGQSVLLRHGIPCIKRRLGPGRLRPGDARGTPVGRRLTARYASSANARRAVSRALDAA